MLSAKQRKAVALYCHGPDELRGDWEASCRAAGFKRLPKWNEALRQAVTQEGGLVPADARARVHAPTELPPLPDPADPEVDWLATATRLLPTWQAIARGDMDVTPSQRQVLQDIMNRGFGRPGAGTAEQAAGGLRVVVLPTLGTDANMRVCPTCLSRLEDE